MLFLFNFWKTYCTSRWRTQQAHICPVCESVAAWLHTGLVISGGFRFESRPGLLRTKVYSAFHPSEVGKWVAAMAGKAVRCGSFRCAYIVQVKLWNLPWQCMLYLSALEMYVSCIGAIRIDITFYPLPMYCRWVVWKTSWAVAPVTGHSRRRSFISTVSSISSWATCTLPATTAARYDEFVLLSHWLKSSHVTGTINTYCFFFYSPTGAIWM